VINKDKSERYETEAAKRKIEEEFKFSMTVSMREYFQRRVFLKSIRKHIFDSE